MKLTPVERLSLWNQYEILKHLNPDDVAEYDKNQEILSSGYELFYSDLNSSIYEETVDEDVGREVQDILDMFRALHFSAEKHGYTPKSSSAKFEGFDGNESTGHYGLAQFIRRSQGRWSELNDRPDNSHSSMSLWRYRQMLQRWRDLGKGYELTPAQIEEVAG